MKKENREENQTVAKKKKTTNEDTFIKTLVMCTPKKMKKEIATYEISMTKQMPWICAGVCILIAGMLSYAYSLTIEKWVLTIGVAIIFSGTILMEMIREKMKRKSLSTSIHMPSSL